MIILINRTDFFRMIRKLSLITIMLFISFSTIYCQQTRKDVPPLKDRLFFGGSFGLQFGTITDIQLSPIIGLWVLPRLGIAAGPNFRFYKYHYDRTNIYGGRSYLQFIFLQDLNSIIPFGVHTSLFFHIEYEALSLQSSFWKMPPYTAERFMISTVLAGGGFSQQIGRRSSLNFMLLWALNDSGYGIYSNPEIRVGFVF
jgi:hypothetical protein